MIHIKLFWLLGPKKQVDIILAKRVILRVIINRNESTETRKMILSVMQVCNNEKSILRCLMWIEKHLKAISEKGSAGLVNDWLGGTNEIKIMIRFQAQGPGG